MSTLIALDDAVRRFGPAVLSDPAALRGALRSGDIRPSDPAVDALTQAASTPVLRSMRAALERTRDPGRALACGVDATRSLGCGLPAARWACIMIGAAAGLLPREWATDDSAPAPGSQPSRRRGALLAGAAAAVVAAVAVAATAAVGALGPQAEPVRVASSAPATSTPATAEPVPSVTGPATTWGTTTAPQYNPPVRHPDYSGAGTADPHAAFRDPQLLALATPYLTAAGADCVAQDPSTYFTERVLCYVGGGRVAFFRKALDVTVMKQERSGIASNASGTARTGTIHATRWAPVAGQPALKTDVPGASTGQGTRIRWVTTKGYRDLYFDQDATACSGMISVQPSAYDPEDALRDYWANPIK